MVNFRRNRLKGGTYFFTVTLNNRRSNLLIEHINLLRHALGKVKKENPYKSLAWVILPDHLHVIWELPLNDDNYSERWRLIKNYFTKSLKKQGLIFHQNGRGEHNLWQRRFWEHTIKDEKSLETHINYIHYNPVKHGLVKNVKDWPHSSFHKYVNLELLDIHWGSEKIISTTENFGE